MSTQNWAIKVDTSFEARSSAGQVQRIRFSYFGQTRLDGWMDVFVQERRNQPYRCQCVFCRL